MEINITGEISNRDKESLKSLIIYIRGLIDIGYSTGELLTLIGNLNGALLESAKVKYESRIEFYKFIEECTKKSIEMREKSANNV